MPIISVEIKKTIDEKEMQKTTKEKQTKTERSKGNRSYSERVRAKWFCCAFKLGVLQSIFKSNLELALSIILKQRELWVKACFGLVDMFLKIRDFWTFLISSPILVLKWQQF